MANGANAVERYRILAVSAPGAAFCTRTAIPVKPRAGRQVRPTQVCESVRAYSKSGLYHFDHFFGKGICLYKKIYFFENLKKLSPYILYVVVKW